MTKLFDLITKQEIKIKKRLIPYNNFFEQYVEVQQFL